MKIHYSANGPDDMDAELIDAPTPFDIVGTQMSTILSGIKGSDRIF